MDRSGDPKLTNKDLHHIYVIFSTKLRNHKGLALAKPMLREQPLLEELLSPSIIIYRAKQSEVRAMTETGE